MRPPLKTNYFKLAASHKRITTVPLRIQGLQVLGPNDEVEIECTLLFRWNAEKSRFDLIQRARLQGKAASTDTVIAYCDAGQEVEFLLMAAGKSLHGQLRKAGQMDFNTFSVGYTFSNKPVRLHALAPEKPPVKFVPQVVLEQK